MTRENFYFLLELPVDPPEESPDVIEKAIKTKQAEWSRNRNHPTKGIQAQTNIGLMPTIREVMFDPTLRRKEAAKAQEISQQRDAQKFAVTDHHVAILGTKGYITEDEINKLALFDKVNVDELRKRVKFPNEPAKKRKLRKFKVLSADSKDKKKTSAHTLDKTVEGIINDNLKQLDKASLYDFLDLPANAKLSQLQRRTRQKKSELSEVSKKDASLTASDIIAGHCISVFKNARSRKAYDTSRASAHHAELNSDIDIAGLIGFIRYESFEYLVKTGVQFGMDADQATDHIEEYCLNNNLAVEQAPVQISRLMRVAIGAIAGFILIMTLIIGYIWYSECKKNEEKKAQIIQEQERVQLYNEAVRKADDYVAKAMYMQAIEVYKQFSKENTGTNQSKDTAKKIKAIKDKIESKNYEQIQRIDPDRYDKKLSAYLGHLEKFPKGQLHEEIKKLIVDIKDPYFLFVLKMINQYQQADKENWNECIRLSQLFVDTYTDDERNDDLKRNIEEYNENIKIRNSFEEERVVNEADDYLTAKNKYKHWFEEIQLHHPYAKTLVERKLKDILKSEKNERAKKARLAIRQGIRETGGRFKETRKGVVQDLRTGKMWTLLDSTIRYDFKNYGECLNYANAEIYVKRLRNGGYKDWRLPSRSELQNIYGKKPVFPINQTEWYWTNKSYKKYDANISGRVVDIVFPNSEKIWQKFPPIDGELCGAVRAIRP